MPIQSHRDMFFSFPFLSCPSLPFSCLSLSPCLSLSLSFPERAILMASCSLFPFGSFLPMGQSHRHSIPWLKAKFQVRIQSLNLWESDYANINFKHLWNPTNNFHEILNQKRFVRSYQYPEYSCYKGQMMITHFYFHCSPDLIHNGDAWISINLKVNHHTIHFIGIRLSFWSRKLKWKMQWLH